MKLKRGMRVRTFTNNTVGTITDIQERGSAGSDVTYIHTVVITYDNGLVYKCDPAICVLVEEHLQEE
jgi:hypothetical protein